MPLSLREIELLRSDAILAHWVRFWVSVRVTWVTPNDQGFIV